MGSRCAAALAGRAAPHPAPAGQRPPEPGRSGAAYARPPAGHGSAGPASRLSTHRVDDPLGVGEPGVGLLAALGADVVDERPQLADAVGRGARGE